MSATENSLARGFVAAAARFPGKPALNINGEFFSYRELLDMAGRVGAQLPDLTDHSFVGLYTAESAWTYAALLAIIMRGHAYVPLSPKHPPARLNELVRLCDLEVIVTADPSGLDVKHEILIDREVEAPGEMPVRSACAAYVLFTSGSTGVPKAVPVSHYNLAPLFAHFGKQFDLNEEDRILQPFELSFDMSVFSIFLAWHHGACLYVVSTAGSKPLNMIAILRDEQITVAPMVPTVLDLAERYFDELKFDRLRYCFFAGERLLVNHARKWQKVCPDCRIYNCYGPTEAAILCTTHQFNPAADYAGTDVPIGRMFDGVGYLLLDEDNKPVSGEGELCLAGQQVMEGYLYSGGSDGFFSFEGTRYYRSGDRVRVDRSGELHFTGRIDRQVKISGHRVEPAEVENTIIALAGKRAAVCVVGSGSLKKLVAFVEGPIDVEFILTKLAEKLPPFMIPARMIAIELLPVGMHEKIDRQRLTQLYEEQFNA